MADLRLLKDRAADLVARGRLDEAAEAYRQVLVADPRDVASRQKLADALRRAGRGADAVAAYRAAADRYAADGLLIKAIAVCKVVLEIDPTHVETPQALARLYARSGRGDPAPAARPRTAAPPGASPYGAILSAAAAARDAGVEDPFDIDEEPPQEAAEVVALQAVLPPVPLFSDLSGPAFVALAERMALRRVRRDEVVLREGEPGDRFYVVASGRLRVERRDESGERVRLAELADGSFFGEMALLSGAPRSASVVAAEDGELLEIRADVLAGLCAEHPHVADSLARFYRQRLLGNAMATCAIFQPFGTPERRRIMQRFRARDVAAGERVVTEGVPSDGLYVVLRGELDVRKRTGAGEVLAARLREGDLFGEMSCLSRRGATASVVARRDGTVLRLPRGDFDEVVAAHPGMLERLAELSAERAESLDAIVSGHARYTEEGLVLV